MAQKNCDTILDRVRSSNLNFVLQETPFSIFLTIRKSFNKNLSNQPYPEPNLDSDVHDSDKLSDLMAELKSLRTENKNIKAKKELLEQSQVTLAKNYAEEVTECEHLKGELIGNVSKLNNLQNNFEKMNSNLKIIENEKKQLGVKHEKTCAEVKVLKSEKDDLEKEKSKIIIALKTAKKEGKEKNHEHEKIIKKKDETIEDLLAFKLIKTSEEKSLRNKQKKLEKKLRSVQQIEQEVKEHKTLDLNDNEPKPESLDENLEISDEKLTDFVPSLPTHN